MDIREKRIAANFLQPNPISAFRKNNKFPMKRWKIISFKKAIHCWQYIIQKWRMYSDMDYSSGSGWRVFQNIAKVFIKSDNSSILILCHLNNFIISNSKESFLMNRLHIMSEIVYIRGYPWKDIFINKESQRIISSKGTYSCSFTSVAA